MNLKIYINSLFSRFYYNMPNVEILYLTQNVESSPKITV